MKSTKVKTPGALRIQVSLIDMLGQEYAFTDMAG